MVRFLIICSILFCIVIKSRGQNLVPNPSFENHTDCSSALITNAVNWCSSSNGGGGCGYMQFCQSDLFYKAPRQYLDACFQSYQPVRTGIAYAEMGTLVLSATQESNHPFVKLIDTLKAGKIYCVTYYVSLFNNAKYTIDKLGALLTPTPFPCFVAGGPTVAIAGQYTPQVVTTPSVAIGDTLNWTEVSGSFTAIGNEAYLTIGDFFTHSQHYIKNSYPTNCNGLAEYYVDDVSVEEVQLAKAKNDTLIYQGDSVVIGNNASEAALFNWQPSAGLSCTNCPNPKASPTITTTYTVTKTQCKSVTTDVITISVSPTGINELNINNAFTLQPNPTNGVLRISTSLDVTQTLNDKNVTIQLLNSLGQILLSETVNDTTHQLNLQNFAEGIYFVKVSYANGQSVIKKVVLSF
jgi:hypothetical protein